MYMTWGVARRRWLWIAVIWMPCPISFFITGFTSSCKSDDRGFRNFLHLPKKQQRHRHDGDGGEVGNRALSEHDHCPGDGADRRRRAAVDESDDGRLLAVFAEIRRGDDGEEIARQER